MWIVFTLIIIGLLFLIIAYICYYITFGYSKKLDGISLLLPNEEDYMKFSEEITRLINDALIIPYEEVYIKTYDGHTLFGRYYHVKENAPVQILFPGYRGNAMRDFCGGLQSYLELGFNVLLVDQRAHGKSKAKSITFGVRERYDCVEWIKYVIKRFGNDVQIIITGISMGASTVLMASNLGLPINVKGIIADCGYTSPKDIIRKVIKDRHYPVNLTYFLVRMGGKIYGGFDIEKSSAESSVAKTNIPIFFVHGENDKFVPVEMTIQNYKSCSSKCIMLIVKEAAHGISFLVDRKSYQAAVGDFLKQININFN